MKTPILGSTYVARSVNAADARMVNLFPEIVPEAGKEPAFLNRAPGLRLEVTVGTGPVRGLWQLAGNMYVVSGTEFYKVTPAYVVTLIGSVSGTGPVSLADNGIQLFIACNGPSFIYNSSTNAFQQITTAGFPGAVTVAFLDGYFVFNKPNSQEIYVTSLYDGLSVDPTDVTSAEGSPDGVVGLIADHGQVWVYGTNSIQVFFDSGGLDFPLSTVQGAFNELGCAAAYSIAKMDNGLFWLGKDARGQGIVYRANGYAGQRISTHAVEWHIQQYGDLSDTIGYTYQQDGHSFYVLIFPSADTSWVYDVATQAWHERAGFANGEFTRHRSNCQVFFNNEVLVGDYQNGNVYAFDLDVYADNGSIQKWLRSWRALATGTNTLKRTAHHSLQLDCETGVGLNLFPAYDAEELTAENGDILIAEYVQNEITAETGEVLTTEAGDGFEPLVDAAAYPVPFVPPMMLSTIGYAAAPGYDPQVMLRWSDDGGHTYSNEHWVSIGKIGEYYRRAIWRRLGMTMKLRDRVYEVSATDPVKIVIMGAELMISPTNA